MYQQHRHNNKPFRKSTYFHKWTFFTTCGNKSISTPPSIPTRIFGYKWVELHTYSQISPLYYHDKT